MKQRGQDVEAARLVIKVQPKARCDDIAVVEGGELRVQVTAPPERGRANEAVVSLLSRRLGVARGNVRILRGLRARNKVVEVEGLPPDEVLRRMSSGR